MVEIVLNMIRIRCTLEIALVTGVAIRWCPALVIIIVAIVAVGAHMGSGQRETRLIMIESHRLPGRFVVADRAVLGEIILHVAGRSHFRVITLMTPVTIGRHNELIIRMTIQAGNRRMRSTQFIAACLQVIECRARPGLIVMTDGAFGQEAECRVGRVDRGVIILLVAGKAYLRCAGVTGSMAVPALGSSVRPANGERARMLEIGNVPAGGDRLMTLAAIRRESCQLVIGIVSLHEIRAVAPLTIERRAGKLIPLLIDMAGAAIGNRMYPHERESARGMQIENVLLILPALGRVAGLARYAELPSMNICVAVGASRADLRKAQFFVAVAACHRSVRPYQRKTRFLMAKRYGLLDLAPRLRVMTVETFPGKFAVWALHCLPYRLARPGPGR